MQIGTAEQEALFDLIPDVVYFAKDREGRYTSVNETLVRRCGKQHKRELLGRTPLELFPAPLGEAYAAQDQRVVRAGEPIFDRLELHLFAGRSPGWCVTRKLPVRERGRVIGLVGISRDLGRPDAHDPVYPRLGRVVDHLHAHLADEVRIADLARIARLSVSQLERQFSRVFQLAPQRFLVKLRLEHAAVLLDGRDRISAIAQACGYADHSAFTRQFRAVVGVTPRDYRRLRASRAGDSVAAAAVSRRAE
jgi:AraC-like DNA-binding protein